MFRILLVFVRRLWLPLVVFALFSLMCVLVYRRLEGLIWQDALFWMIQPHAIDAKRVHNSTKLFSIFVYCGVFGFQIWVAERVAVTIFNRQGVEAWRTMVNDVSIEKLRDHFIICGLRAGWPYRGGSANPIEDSVRADRDQRRIVQGTAEGQSAGHPGRC